MKVQTRLSLFSSIVFGVIFAIMSFLIYALYLNNAEKSIYENLKKTTYIIALFHLEEDELNNSEFAKVKTQFREIVSNSYYQVYDEKDIVSYGSQSASLTIKADILNAIREEQHLSFSDGDFFCHGIFYKDNQGDFVVIAREKKEILAEQINLLLWILIPAFLLSIVVIIFLSKWIAHIAYRPFRKVIREVNNISTDDLTVHIESPKTADELEDLIATFNTLLAKISETVIIQRNFVSYVSHEFKTPLSSMLGNLEVFSLKDRSPEEYEEVSQKLVQEIYQMKDILNTLIVVSDLRKDADTLTPTRIDEIIWQIVAKLSERYPSSKILVNLNILPEDEQMLTVTQDRTQLLMALFNLIENAVKYSQGNTVDIHISKKNGLLQISIIDKGIGIPSDQLANISKPFYRADNANMMQGSGIGLSIALRILEKNSIEYSISSEMNIGTLVVLIFK